MSRGEKKEFTLGEREGGSMWHTVIIHEREINNE